ncbi:MAG: hypothetical protein WKF71_01755 [Pyrinomonadaceae bacterium]
MSSRVCANIASAQKNKKNSIPKAQTIETLAEDFHSYSKPQTVRVRHVELVWNVLFDKKILQGMATLTVERAPKTKNASARS